MHRREDTHRRLGPRRDELRSQHQDHRRGSDIGDERKRIVRDLGPRKMSRSRSPLLRLHHERNKKEAERERGFYDTYNREQGQQQLIRHSRERERRSPLIKSHVVQGQGQQSSSRRLRMDEPLRRSRSNDRRDHEHKHIDHDRHMSAGVKRNVSSSIFVDLDRAVKRAREQKSQKTDEKWGHSGFKELYPAPNERRGNQHKSHLDNWRSRSRSPQHPPRKLDPPRIRLRSKSPRKLLPARRSRSTTPPRSIGLKSIVAPQRPSSPKGKPSSDKWTSKHPDTKSSGYSKHKEDQKSSHRLHIASEIGNKKHNVEKSLNTGKSGLLATERGAPKQKQSTAKVPPALKSSRPNSGKGVTQRLSKKSERRNSSSSDFSSRTPSPQLKKKTEVKDQQRKQPVSTKHRSSSSDSSSDEDVLEIHARDRQQSLSNSGHSSSSDEDSDESVRKTGSRSPISSSFSDDTRTSPNDGSLKNVPEKSKKTLDKDKSTAQSGGRSSGAANNGKTTSKVDSSANKSKTTPPTSKKSTPPATTAKTKGSASESESESSSESDEEPRMTLSERFAKLTQMSRDKREFAKPEISITEIDTKLKVVKDLRNADTKVYVNQVSRPVSARSRPKSPDFNFKEGDMKYSSDDRRRHFERMSRDEPMDRDRPDDWSDVRVRFSYYKSRGYFDERPLTLEEYSKWEAWWYEYRDWLAEEGYYDNQNNVPPKEYRDVVMADDGRNAGRMHRDSKNWHPPSFNGMMHGEHRRQSMPPQPEPLLAHPIRFDDRRFPPVDMGGRIPVSRRIGHAPGGSLLVNVPPTINPRAGGGFRGRGRLAGRLGFRR